MVRRREHRERPAERSELSRQAVPARHSRSEPCRQTQPNLPTAFDSLVGSAMVGRAVTRPTATPEPRLMISPHAALRHTSPCHRHSIGTIAHPQSLAHVLSELDCVRSSVRYGHITSDAPAIRLELILHPCLLVCRPHVCISQASPWALASWAIPPARAYGLAAYSHC